MSRSRSAAVGERREVRVAGRQHQGDAASRRGRGRRRPAAAAATLAGVEPVELGDVVDVHGEVVGVGEQVLLEPRGQGRDALVEVVQRRSFSSSSRPAPARVISVCQRSTRYCCSAVRSASACSSCSNTVVTRAVERCRARIASGARRAAARALLEVVGEVGRVAPSSC